MKIKAGGTIDESPMVYTISDRIGIWEDYDYKELTWDKHLKTLNSYFDIIDKLSTN